MKPKASAAPMALRDKPKGSGTVEATGLPVGYEGRACPRRASDVITGNLENFDEFQNNRKHRTATD